MAPGGLLAKVVAGIDAPGHTVLLAGKVGAVTDGLGLTVIVKLEGVPAQPLTVGVTVTVLVIGVLPPLVEVNTGVEPLPLAPRPVPVLSLVQVKVPPGGVLVKVLAGTDTLGQTETGAGTFTVGAGLIVIV